MNSTSRNKYKIYKEQIDMFSRVKKLYRQYEMDNIKKKTYKTVKNEEPLFERASR
jgi:hypothetical protein